MKNNSARCQIPNVRSFCIPLAYPSVATILVCLTLTTFGQTDPQLTVRSWADLSGKFSVEAGLASLKKDQVVLLKPDRNTVTLPVGRLSKSDQEYLRAWRHIQSSTEQEAEVLQLIERLATAPTESVEKLSTLHRQSDGVVPGLICGGMLASEGTASQSKEAEKYLDQSIARLRLVHEHFPDAHPNTLVSALNNRAVLSLRSRTTGQAVALLVEASEVEPAIPYVVYHNASMLLEVSKGESVFKSTAGSAKRLEVLIPSTAPTLSGLSPPRRFLYSSLFDHALPANPATALPKTREEALQLVKLWPELNCFLCNGNGIRDCASCTRGMINVPESEPIGFDAGRNRVVMGIKYYKAKCEHCRGKGSFACRGCTNGRIPFDD